MSKQCSGCRLVLGAADFWKKSSGKGGLQAKCKSCQRAEQKARVSTEAGKRAAQEASKRWLSDPDNHELAKQQKREWARRNPEWFRQWREKHPEKVAEAQRKTLQRGSQNLNDSYVKRSIARGEFSHLLIPSSLVDLKRSHLMIHRELNRKDKA